MLTDAQYTVLANHIRSNVDPDVVAALSIRNDTEISRLYNLETDYFVWREEIPAEEYREVIDWAEFELLTTGEYNIWREIGGEKPINATKQNIRQGFSAIFNNSPNTKNALVALAKRNASLFESLFAVGDGTNQNPSTPNIIGKATIDLTIAVLCDSDAGGSGAATLDVRRTVLKRVYDSDTYLRNDLSKRKILITT